jgi:hypothetical protein
MIWPIVEGRGVVVPSVGRLAVVPLSGNRPALGIPPSFDPCDPQDVDVFAWDWSVIDFPNDAITSVSVTSEPPLIAISKPILVGALVQVFVGPGPAEDYDLTCHVTFSTGRILSWGVEISVQPL